MKLSRLVWQGLCVLLLVGAIDAHAAKCPPPNAGAAKPVVGKPGEKGWLITTERDDSGNRIEQWCLEAKAATPDIPQNPKAHGGPDFAYRWISTTGTDVWIGACTFGCGENVPNKQFVDVNNPAGTGRPNGVPDKFIQATWKNMQRFPQGTADWDYSFNPTTGKLTVAKTTGQWVLAVNPRTGKIFVAWLTTGVTGTDTYDAPVNFSDLMFEGGQITSASGLDGRANEAYLAFANPDTNGLLDVTLRAMEIGGEGTLLDPYSGVITTIYAGDTFTIGGVGVSSPFVTGLAALIDYGGWVVDAFDSSYVSFMATADATFYPGTDITGFGLYSSGPPGLMPWALASVDENTSSSGLLLPEPPSWPVIVLGMIALFGMGCRGR
jgi:hypothetical protein